MSLNTESSISGSDPVVLSNHTRAVVAFSLVRLHGANLRLRVYAPGQHLHEVHQLQKQMEDCASGLHSQATEAAKMGAGGSSAVPLGVQPLGGGRETTGSTMGEWGQRP